MKGAWRAWSTFCQGVTAPPRGSTISASTPARFAASMSVSSLSPSMAVRARSAPARSIAARRPLVDGFPAWPWNGMPRSAQNSVTRVPERLLETIITWMPAAFIPAIHARRAGSGLRTDLGARVKSRSLSSSVTPQRRRSSGVTS